jgi:LysR family transcriptional regulator, transcriptional activator for dmlA
MERADLQLILAIRNTGSMVQAGQLLRLSPPVVTKRLAALEALLGLKLFFRTTRQVSPTAEGDVLCERATTLLQQFEQLEEALRESSQEPSGPIRLASTFGFGRIWLGPALAAFQKQYPAVRIDCHLTETLPDLGAQGYDAAVWLWSPKATRVSQWTARTLASNQRVLVAAPAYLAVNPSPQNLVDLATHDCLIVRESDATHCSWQLVNMHEKKPSFVQVSGGLSSNSGELVRDWCLAGRGIMLRSLWDIAPQLASGALVRVLPDYAMPEADIQWLAPFRTHTPKRVALLRDFLTHTFKTQPWAINSKN